MRVWFSVSKERCVMRGVEIRMRHILILALGVVTAAGCKSAPRSEAEHPEQEDAAVRAMEVQITPPTAKSATLIVRRDGQAGYDRLPTRVTGGRTTVVPLGREESFSIAASEAKLQRIEIDGLDYVLGVDPGDTLVFTDSPCNGWDLRGANWEVNKLSPPQITCAARSSDCPQEYSASPLPGLADDPVCSADETRCVLTTTFEISAASTRDRLSA
jgi:hypothetical protein